jgi:hypothetical protein
LTLGGTLNVSLINSFHPAVGNSFDIMDWGSLSGTFSAVQLPALGLFQAWNTDQLYTSGILSVISTALIVGDVDRNNQVNVADISALETALSDLDKYKTAHNLDEPEFLDIADLNADNAVNNLDLQAIIDYQANSGGGFNAVPEPASLILAVLATPIACVVRRTSRRSVLSC